MQDARPGYRSIREETSHDMGEFKPANIKCFNQTKIPETWYACITNFIYLRNLIEIVCGEKKQ